MAGRKAYPLLAFLLTLVVPSLLNAGELYGISKPSAEVALSFTLQGRIADVRAKEGDRVLPGQTIAIQDTAIIEARIRQVRLEAESRVEVEAAKAESLQREQEVQKIAQAHEEGAATDLELERARLEVEIALLRMAAAEEKQAIASHRLEEMLVEKELHYLRAPTAGTIERLQMEPGEAPPAFEPIALLVSNNPLWIEVPVPLRVADTISPGDEIAFVFPDGDEGVGVAIAIATVADPASETVLLRFAMDNPSNRRSGERVRFSHPAYD